MSDTPAPTPMTARRSGRPLQLVRRFGTLLGLAAIVATFWVLRPDTFMTVGNWLNITQQVSILAVVAFTSTAVMVTGAFDLSVGTLASLSGMLVAAMMQAGVPIPVAIALALLAAAAAGALNGILVAFVRIVPFVATLGTLTMFGGLALLVSDGSTIFGRSIPAAFGAFGRGGIPLGDFDGRALVVPNLTLVAGGTLLVTWALLEHTAFGRRLYAVGGNRVAAHLAGLRVRTLVAVAFVVNGLGAGLAGLMLTSRLASANPTQGDGLMLNAIAAVFLGVTTSREGEPHVLGTLVGVLILGVLANGLTQLQIDTYVQQVLTGAIVIVAVAFGSVSRRA